MSKIKKLINPTEIRCCWDNALWDIKYKYFIIYYKDKEVTFVGTNKEVWDAEDIVDKLIL